MHRLIAQILRPDAPWRALCKQIQRNRNAYLFIAPFYLLFAVFMVFPIGFSLYLSFLDWNGIMQPQPAGWANYHKALHDPSLHNAMLNTAIYTLCSVALSLAVGLALALFLNSLRLLKRVYRSIFFIPSVISLVVVGLVWKLILNSEVGLLREGLRVFGDALFSVGLPVPECIGPACHILDNPNPLVPLLTMVFVGTWVNVGFSTVIFLAGLQGIPAHLYDVSRIDGATRLQNLRYITLPLLRPTMFFVVFITTIDALQMFVLPNVMNRDSESTMTIVYYLYRNAFEFYRMGYACAIAYLLFALSLALGFAIRMLFGSDVRWAVPD